LLSSASAALLAERVVQFWRKHNGLSPEAVTFNTHVQIVFEIQGTIHQAPSIRPMQAVIHCIDIWITAIFIKWCYLTPFHHPRTHTR